MLAATAPLTTMLDGSDQTGEWVVWIDIPEYPDAKLDASEVEIDASMTTDLPDQARLIEGYPTMQATFTLAGLVDKSDETKTIGWLLGRYSTTSPLWGTDVNSRDVWVERWSYPDGCEGVPVRTRKFTGSIDTYTQGPGGTVQFTCLDKRNSLRAVPETAPAITASPWYAGLTTEYAMDAVLRRASGGAISSWPALRPQCVLAVGMRTSLWPEVGTLRTDWLTTPPTFAPGRWGSGLAAPAVDGSGSAFYNLVPTIGSTVAPSADVVVDFTVNGGTDNSSSVAAVQVWNNTPQLGNDTAVEVQWHPTAGQIVVHLFNQTSPGLISSHTINVGTTGGGHRIVAHFHFTNGGSSWAYDVNFDGTLYSGSVTIPSGLYYSTGFATALAQVTNSATLTIEALQITSESTSSAWTGAFAFTPRAVLDPSLNPLQVVPAYSGDPFQVIQQMCAAENGYAGFDEDGQVFRFLNRDTLARRDLAATITSEDALAEIDGIESSSASVINRAQIGFAPWQFAQNRSTVYSPAIPRSVPPRGSVTFKVKLDTYAVDIDTAPAVLASGATDGTGNPTNKKQSWYRASKDRNGVNEYAGNLSWSFDQPAPDRLHVTVTNPSSQRVWFVSPANYIESDMPAGIPSLWIAGRAVTQQDEEVADYQYPPDDQVGANGLKGAAGSRFGEIPYQLSGNPWVQDPDAADDLARDIVLAQWKPKPTLRNVSIKPNPLLQRADLVRIVDDANTGCDEYALIFGWTINYKTNDDGTADYTMTVDARTLASPRSWFVPYRSTVGVSTYATR